MAGSFSSSGASLLGVLRCLLASWAAFWEAFRRQGALMGSLLGAQWVPKAPEGTPKTHQKKDLDPTGRHWSHNLMGYHFGVKIHQISEQVREHIKKGKSVIHTHRRMYAHV